MYDDILTDNALLRTLNPIIRSVCQDKLNTEEMESVQAIIMHQVMTNDYFGGMNQFYKLYYGTQFDKGSAFLGHYRLSEVSGATNQELSECKDVLTGYSQRRVGDFGIQGAILSESQRHHLTTIKEFLQKAEGINDVVDYFNRHEDDYYFIYSLKKSQTKASDDPRLADKEYAFKLLKQIEGSLSQKNGFFEYNNKVLSSEEKEAFFSSMKKTQAYKKAIYSSHNASKNGGFCFDTFSMQFSDLSHSGWQKSLMLDKQDVDSHITNETTANRFSSDEFKDVLFPQLPNAVVGYESSQQRRDVLDKLNNNQYLYHQSLYQFLKEYERGERDAKIFDHFYFETYRQQAVDEINTLLDNTPSLEQFVAPYKPYIDAIWDRLTHDYPELKGESPDLVYERIEVDEFKSEENEDDDFEFDFELPSIIDKLLNKEALETHGEDYTLEMNYGLKGIKFPDVDMILKGDVEHTFFTVSDSFGVIAHNTVVEKCPSHMMYSDKEATWLYSQQADYMDSLENKTQILEALDQQVIDWAKENLLMLKVDFTPEELNKREHDIIETIINDENVIGYFSGSVNVANNKVETFLNTMHRSVDKYFKDAQFENNLKPNQIYDVILKSQSQLKQMYHQLKEEPEFERGEGHYFREQIQKDVIDVFKENEKMMLDNKNALKKPKH